MVNMSWQVCQTTNKSVCFANDYKWPKLCQIFDENKSLKRDKQIFEEERKFMLIVWLHKKGPFREIVFGDDIFIAFIVYIKIHVSPIFH